jgi:hypothetical protein
MLFHALTLRHVQYVSDWAWRRNAQASIDLPNFTLTVRCSGLEKKLFARFLIRPQGRLAYSTSLLTEGNQGCIGWLPYERRQWPLAVNKLAFKEACAESGLLTPPWWPNPAAQATDIVIKPARGSFGIGVRGPFRHLEQARAHPATGEGEFLERYVPGAAVKVWYWEKIPICVEVLEPLEVTGDGEQPIAKLTAERYPLSAQASRDAFEDRKPALDALLAYQGVHWATVLPRGRLIVVDFLYGSPLRSSDYENTNRLATLAEPMRQELFDAGCKFWQMLPLEHRNGVLYATDGVIDSQSRVWWLEMNCNPTVPPDGYAHMLDTLFEIDPS